MLNAGGNERGAQACLDFSFSPFFLFFFFSFFFARVSLARSGRGTPGPVSRGRQVGPPVPARDDEAALWAGVTATDNSSLCAAGDLSPASPSPSMKLVSLEEAQRRSRSSSAPDKPDIPVTTQHILIFLAPAAC